MSVEMYSIAIIPVSAAELAYVLEKGFQYVPGDKPGQPGNYYKCYDCLAEFEEGKAETEIFQLRQVNVKQI